jgi:hypothetical protein
MITGLERATRRTSTTLATMLALAGAISLSAQARHKAAPPAGVEEVCSISFDKDPLRPARVENSALACLKEAAKRLNASPGRKLVLVGGKDPAKDHEAAENGSDREEEDATGFDVRLEDLSAYRAVNTKWYLVYYLNADPKRILPTTDESYFAQTVTFYLVPASADFNHNFLGTTKTNEKPCTITPCYSPDEESLTAQAAHRGRLGGWIACGDRSGEEGASCFAASQIRCRHGRSRWQSRACAAGSAPNAPTPGHNIHHSSVAQAYAMEVLPRRRFQRAETNLSMSSKVLYSASEARTVLSRPKRRRIG